jgi:hypothetical protein
MLSGTSLLTVVGRHVGLLSEDDAAEFRALPGIVFYFKEPIPGYLERAFPVSPSNFSRLKLVVSRPATCYILHSNVQSKG